MSRSTVIPAVAVRDGMRRDSPVDRRSLLQSVGVLASLSTFGTEAAAAGGGETAADVPAAARTVEGGLSSFVTKWEAGGPVIAATRFGRFLTNKTFNCQVADAPRAFNLRIAGAEATLATGRDPTAHATLVLEEADWLAVLYGDYSGLAPLVNGRAWVQRDEQNKGALLLLAMYVFAHVPSGAGNLESLARTLEDGGLPECEGQPPAFRRLEDTRDDPGEAVDRQARGAGRTASDVPDVTRRLAEWVADLSYDDVPAAQIRRAKAQIKSILGVAYAGSAMPHAGSFVDVVRDFGDAPEATVVGADSFRTSAHNAAMTNSYLAQMLEWEDWTYLAHTGAAVVPTALAAAERANAGGRALLTAVVAGNEIAARVGEFQTDVLSTGQGLQVHQSELPLVAGSVAGLDASRLQDAVGIAATQPQLTSFPAWTAGGKGMVTGGPVHTSMRAARFAEGGLSGRRDQLENPLGYFYRVSDVRHPSDLATAVAGLGETWRFADQHFDKRYPTDGFQLTAVHATLAVRDQLRDAGIDPAEPDNVAAIDVRVPLVMAASATMFNDGSASILDRVLDPAQPDWTYTALLFDGYYPLAAALVDGELTPDQYLADRLRDDAIREYYETIELHVDVLMGVFGAKVTVTTDEGETFAAPVEGGGADGGAETFSSFVACIREDVNEGWTADDKFRQSAGRVLSDRRVERVLAAVDDLESFDDVSRFAARL